MKPERLRDDFLGTIRHIRRILQTITTNSGPRGILTAPDLHKLAEGLFLSAWTHWEQFTHLLLVEDLAELQGSLLNKEVSAFKFKRSARRIANRLLSHPDHPTRFIEWSDYRAVVDRADEFLGSGNRFSRRPLPRRVDLDQLKRVRNAVAHRSDKAWASFRALCGEHPYSLETHQMRGITPGRFLVAHRINGKSILMDALDILDAAAESLVP